MTESPKAQPWLTVMGSRHFLDWLAEQQSSLAFTTYQAGKVFFVGRKPDDSLSAFERTYPHCMGMWATPDAQSIWLATRFQVWRLERTATNAVPHLTSRQSAPGVKPPTWQERGFDVVYVPRVGFTTGHLDIHDMAVAADGRLIFVNTLFGCLATLSETASFQPLWRPKFLSALLPEDRCHLNGLAMKDGQAAYVTALAESDVADGWRDRRAAGGVVIDVRSGEIVARGLSMPHSPRWHGGQLWVLNSGTGELGRISFSDGAFEPILFCPGYLRGLTFVGDFAVVTLSKPRHDSFHGLPLDDRLAERGAEAQCSLQVIDLKTGSVAHWLRLQGSHVSELYDVVGLPNVRQPLAVGFQSTEIERLLSIDKEGRL